MNHAKRALELDEHNAEAHLLCALTLGNPTQLKNLASGAMKINQILRHV